MKSLVPDNVNFCSPAWNSLTLDETATLKEGGCRGPQAGISGTMGRCYGEYEITWTPWFTTKVNNTSPCSFANITIPFPETTLTFHTQTTNSCPEATPQMMIASPLLP